MTSVSPPWSKGSAWFDREGAYRYRLTRDWEVTRPRLTWIMLNPSTADAAVDDPTIRRVVGLSRSWGFGSVTVVNLFAEMATWPTALSTSPTRVGPCNDQMIVEAAFASEMVLAAWGNHGALENPATGVARCGEVMDLLVAGSTTMACLGLTRRGQPRHPLYVPSAARPSPLPPAPGKPVAQVSDIL